ncbi:gamma-glutamyltransferase [Pedobacter cryoconitis]|uniref:Glutathione hydrolase proenzyme n=1 Tax=Pedobacter cryoconitis TaxID=188932 RepID=A0A7X0MK74_9SPHI|nr:gamma-glutamyltransferase [Pedobacter cryoconitis]MBB6500390.1 gamma-glutamyltranspeptidase/glutathione hydrolase [Pedobacter cryoconitis]
MRSKKTFSGLLFGAFCLELLVSFSATGQESNQFKHAAVVTAHPEASKVGVAIIKKGGNAVDAAVAVQFALAVVYPNAGNIGGGGFLVYRSKTGQSDALDYREKAPEKASRDMYLDAKGNAITDKSLYGALASGVPGTVDGMVKAHTKYGKLSWKRDIEPAIELAERGFPVTAQQASELNSHKERFLKYNKKAIAFVKNDLWKEGDLLKQPELAKTLKLIRDNGRKGFYEGTVATAIVNSMKQTLGVITAADLKNYHAVWRKTVSGKYKNYTVISMPPPSSGGIALITMLKQVGDYPLNKWGFQKDSTVQLMVEVERRAYADRASYLGDPDFFKVPQAALLNNDYIKSRTDGISFAKATPSSEVKPGTLPLYESEQTTHYSIVDSEGNAVSATTTLNGSYGSLVVVDGGGFIMNNEMDDFSVKPGTPNMYGLVGGEANSIVPGKRMLSSMTPTIIEENGNLRMVVGTPGGSTIITSVFQTILNVLAFGQDMQAAVAAPRFHHQWLPDEVFVEKGAIDDTTRAKLESKGYKITPREPMGRVDAILVKPNGELETGADPRGNDKGLGY